MKTLLRIYKRKLEGALNDLVLAKADVELTPAESEEEAEFLFARAEKRLIAAQKRVEDLREFISDVELYM
jgi:hypothetical protein